MKAKDKNIGWDFVDELYETSVGTTGAPLQLWMFDIQFCENLQEDWLAAAVESSGVTRAELDWMIGEGLLRRWKSPKSKEGFLIYTEHQAVIAKKLHDSGRYPIEELRHIFSDWNSYLEGAVTDEPAYDSLDVDDYEHFRRRATEMAQFFEEEVNYTNLEGLPLPAEQIAFQKKEAAEKLRLWRWIRNEVSTHTESELTPEFQKAWRKHLFQLRWVDEWCRLITAQEFSTQIEQGYSVEVSFQSSGWREGVTTLSDLSWDRTLKRFKDTINEGETFPLRTPDFNVTERGIEFLKTPSPAEYQALHEKYQLAQLSALIEEKGAGLWVCDLAASGRGECAECGKVFEHTKASRKFCGDRCRNRAKARRWREADPERNRMAQARYYKEIYPEGDNA